MRRRTDLFVEPTSATSSGFAVSGKNVSFNNMVIVRIWEGKSYIQGSVGHVSLEIPSLEIYASLWPSQTPGIITEIVPAKWHSLIEDLAKGMKRDPEFKFYLFSLDIEAMRQHYEKRKTRVEGWMLQGASSSVRADTDNCTTLVYGLLKAGGAETLAALVKSHYGSSAGASADWIPNRLAQYLPLLVTAEQASQPETRELAERAKREGAFGIISHRPISISGLAAGGGEASAASAFRAPSPELAAATTLRDRTSESTTRTLVSENSAEACDAPAARILSSTRVAEETLRARTTKPIISTVAQDTLSIKEQMLATRKLQTTAPSTKNIFSHQALLLSAVGLMLLGYICWLYLKTVQHNSIEDSATFSPKP